MKTHLSVIKISFFLFLLISTSLITFGQNSDNGTKLKFTRQSDGKIAYSNTVNQKVFNFIIEGITNQQQANDFISMFQGKKFVVSVNITEIAESNNLRNGIIILERTAKIPNFRELLINAGFSNIYVDDELISVDELEILKTNVPIKTYK